jgi:hypothetical protein
MIKNFKQIPMSELRVRLPRLRRLVQSGNLRIVCTHYGEVTAFLLPLKDIEDLILHGEDCTLKNTEEMPLTDFREKLAEASEKLLGGIDCIYLTFHKRKVVAFLSPRFTCYLSLPLIGESQIVFASEYASNISI